MQVGYPQQSTCLTAAHAVLEQEWRSHAESEGGAHIHHRSAHPHWQQQERAATSTSACTASFRGVSAWDGVTAAAGRPVSVAGKESPAGKEGRSCDPFEHRSHASFEEATLLLMSPVGAIAANDNPPSGQESSFSWGLSIPSVVDASPSPVRAVA